MRKSFLYTLGKHGFQELNQLEEAIICSKRGDKVLYVNCDGSLGPCIQNPHLNKIACNACVREQKANNKKYLPPNVEQHFVSYYLTNRIRKIADNIKFKYSNIDDIKGITYKGVDIGYGAASTYLSLTRNLNPKVNNLFISYIDSLLRMEVLLTEIGEEIIGTFNPNLVILYNGRLASFKPILNLAQREEIKFICTENISLYNSKILKNFYYNKSAHSISANTEKYFEIWDREKNNNGDKKNVARSFFERRRNALKTDDKPYTENQKLGELPNNWDKSKRNICIFNTSEDEFFSISKEFDNSNIFKSQLIAIQEIVNHYIENEAIHFYVRVHPNMYNLNYKYHTDLYKLKYKNLTVIEADSSISSYSLVDASEKIIVFASTMGIEATYWGKPVICLSGTFYRDLNVVHLPKNKLELWKLIEEKHLDCKYNINVLKYGFFYMTDLHEDYQYVNYDYVYYNFGFKQIQIQENLRLFGSNLLFMIYLTIVNLVIRKLKITSKFKSLPIEEV